MVKNDKTRSAANIAAGKFLVPLIVVVLLFTNIHTAEANSTSPVYTELDQLYASTEYTAFTSRLYNAAPIEDIRQSLTELNVLLDSYPGNRTIAALGKAHAAIMFGKHLVIEEYCMDKDLGRQILEKTEDSLHDLAEECAEVRSMALSLEGELSGSLFLLNPVSNLFTYGLASSNLIDEARSLDPLNVHAILMEASRLLHAPRLFGGNPVTCDTLLDNFPYDISGLPKFHQFTFYLLRGMAASQRKRNTLSEDWYHRALELYPGNQYIRELLGD